MKGLTKIAFVSAFIFASIAMTTSQVFAQYESDIVDPRYEGGNEVFDIDTDGAKKITIFPQGCGIVDKMVFDFSEAVKGNIKISSNGDKSPISGKDITKVVEYCTLELTGIEEKSIKTVTIDAKVRKSWLDSEKVDKDKIAVFSFEGDNWKSNKTKREKDNSIYYYYSSETKFSKNIAAAQSTSSSNLFGFSPLMIIICCVLLLLVLLLLSILYSFSSRSRRRNVNIYS